MKFGTPNPRVTALLILSAGLAACGQTGSNYRPIVDGPMGYAYEQDLAQCKQIAEQRSLLNDETKMAALAGAVIGGVVGAVEAENNTAPGGAAIGALAGGAIGAGGGAIKAHDERKQIVINCMSGRGHRVVG